MYSPEQLAEYLAEVRQQVCSHCIERPLGGPPCAPQGKNCGIELHLAEIVEICHRANGQLIDPYIDQFHEDACSHCANKSTSQCPCPLDYLLTLAVQAIESVDARNQGDTPPRPVSQS
jgi:hypothetical protein